MNLSLSKILILIIVIFTLANCAKRGRPTGGEKDLTAPILISASPKQESIQFDATKIKIYFDEYVKLKDVNKQLIVSPPLKNTLDITPVGTASKIITIKLIDTLKENTTYTFNFGNSVVDNNEGNPLKSFKYVFSTGAYIDSLKASGDITDAYSRKTASDILVMLYEMDSTFNDSIIYKEKPTYVSSTLDSTNFNFSNLKEGKYLAIAIQQPNNTNYIYNPKQDKIGFVKEPVILPLDTAFNIYIFKEKLPFKFIKALETSKGHIVFGYEGDAKDLKVKLLDQNLADTLKAETVFEKGKDSLSFWYKPIIKDSLIFAVSNQNFIDTVTVKLKTSKQDTLAFKNTFGSTLSPRDTFAISANIPIVKIDPTKFSFVNKDTIAIPFSTKIDAYKKNIAIHFENEYDNMYTINLLPNALIDVFGNTNDTLTYKFRTRKIEEYGIIKLTVSNVNSPVIIELITEKDEFIAAQKISTNQTITFNNLLPQKYIVRAIFDDNNNNIWDTGNFLLRIQPEKVIYFEKLLEVRANWDYNESFILK